jgi:ribosomal-protein-alanine N-acetyltransferase
MLPAVVGDPAVRTWIALSAGEPTGFAMYALERGGGDFEADLVAIAVAPGSQRRGIGRCLLARVEQEARREAGGRACAVRLTVAEENLAAQGFFTSAGYRPVAGSRGCYPGGQLSRGMRKVLPPDPAPPPSP